jgi:hypothetical protein
VRCSFLYLLFVCVCLTSTYIVCCVVCFIAYLEVIIFYYHKQTQNIQLLNIKPNVVLVLCGWLEPQNAYSQVYLTMLDCALLLLLRL